MKTENLSLKLTITKITGAAQGPHSLMKEVTGFSLFISGYFI